MYGVPVKTSAAVESGTPVEPAVGLLRLNCGINCVLQTSAVVPGVVIALAPPQAHSALSTIAEMSSCFTIVTSPAQYSCDRASTTSGSHKAEFPRADYCVVPVAARHPDRVPEKSNAVVESGTLVAPGARDTSVNGGGPLTMHEKKPGVGVGVADGVTPAPPQAKSAMSVPIANSRCTVISPILCVFAP